MKFLALLLAALPCAADQFIQGQSADAWVRAHCPHAIAPQANHLAVNIKTDPPAEEPMSFKMAVTVTSYFKWPDENSPKMERPCIENGKQVYLDPQDIKWDLEPLEPLKPLESPKLETPKAALGEIKKAKEKKSGKKELPPIIIEAEPMVIDQPSPPPPRKRKSKATQSVTKGQDPIPVQVLADWENAIGLKLQKWLSSTPDSWAERLFMPILRPFTDQYAFMLALYFPNYLKDYVSTQSKFSANSKQELPVNISTTSAR